MRATKIRQDLLLRLQSSLLPGNKKAFKRLQARRPFTYFLTLTPAFINNFTNENIPTHWAFSGVDGKRSLQGFELETILRLPSEIVISRCSCDIVFTANTNAAGYVSESDDGTHTGMWHAITVGREVGVFKDW